MLLIQGPVLDITVTDICLGPVGPEPFGANIWGGPLEICYSVGVDPAKLRKFKDVYVDASLDSAGRVVEMRKHNGPPAD
jgi:hypothetical protein